MDWFLMGKEELQGNRGLIKLVYVISIQYDITILTGNVYVVHINYEQ